MDYQKAFIFGVTVAIAVGPIALLIVYRSINKGFYSGALTGGGVALANFLYGVVGFSLGTSVLRIVQSYAIYFRMFSGFLLIAIAMYMGILSIRNYGKVKLHQLHAASHSDFISGCLLTLTNPLSLAIYLGFIGQITIVHPYQIVIVAGVCALGDLLVELLIAFSASRFRRFFSNTKAILLLNIVSASGIAFFGVIHFLK